jgi:hypothetical protein
MGNMLAMTPQGQTMQALGGGQPQKLAKGGQPKKNISIKYPLAPKNQWYGEGTYDTSGGVMRQITPDQYLSKVKPLTLDEESRENIDLLKQHIQSGKTLDPLLIRANGKEDGRHRAHAAKELGIKHVPVIDYGKHFEPINNKKGGKVNPVMDKDTMQLALIMKKKAK